MQNKGRIALIAALVYAVLSIVIVAAVQGKAPAAVEPVETVEEAQAPQEAEEREAAAPGDPEASFLAQYRLPSLERMDAARAEEYLSDMQVMKKVSALGLTEQDYLYPQRELDALYAALSEPFERAGEAVTFDGDTASALNAFLAEHAGAVVTLSAPTLSVDETIAVPSGTALVGSGTCLEAASELRAISLDHVENVAISGLTVGEGFAYGVYAAGCSGVRIDDCSITGATQKPIIFMGDCNGVVVRNNRLVGNNAGGLYLNGGIEDALIEGNDILDNGGTSNWMAGIVLSGIDVLDEDDPTAPFAQKVHFPAEQPLDTMLKAPHNVIVRDNRVEGNNATGVYCDGPYRVYIVENRIEDNDKEGLCLDYGTIAAYVSGNDIVGNGNRGRQTDQDLEYDFVLGLGRLEDGSAAAKLPGISIDNSAYNIIFNNNISGNYGSGVKMVRSGVRNIVMANLVTGNNRGVSDTFHFFGIELGWAAADEEVINLDFKPAYENIVCRNMITGAHYAGIFISEGAYINDFFDNTIMDATHWALESLSDAYNSIVNNHSNLESRGVEAAA